MLLLFVGYTYLYVMHKSIWTGWRIHYQGPLPLQSSFPNLRHADPRQVLHRNRGGTVVAIHYLLSEVTFFFFTGTASGSVNNGETTIFSSEFQTW